MFSSVFWWFNAGVTPDLIPNSEVKPCCSDDTPMEGKVANRQNTELNKKITPRESVVLFFFVSILLVLSGSCLFLKSLWRG